MSRAAEPSEICEALPAVTTPSSWKAVRRPASDSSVVPRRMPSSAVSRRRPARSRRRTARRRWRRRRARARRPRSRRAAVREKPHFVGDHLGRDALAAPGRCRSARASAAGTGRRRRPRWRTSARATSTRRRRRRRRRSGRRRGPAAAKCTACWLEPHWRSIVVPGPTRGSRRRAAALRAALTPCSPTCETQPQMTSSTSAGSTPGAGDEVARARAPPRSPGWMPDRAPLPGLPTPTGVRIGFDDDGVAVAHGTSRGRGRPARSLITGR